MDKIIDAKDVMREEGDKDMLSRIRRQNSDRVGRGRARYLINEEIDEGRPVKARIDFGRWIADCECGGAEYITPEEPIFFCQSCGNLASDGKLRPVDFPPEEERKEIERLLLERPVEARRGNTRREKAMYSRALAQDDRGRNLGRSWDPEEDVEDLKRQNDFIFPDKKKGPPDIIEEGK